MNKKKIGPHNNSNIMLRSIEGNFDHPEVNKLLVKHFIELTGILPSTLKSISQPKDFPIQFFCIILTLFGHEFNFSKPLSRSSENFEILKNH